LLDDAIDRRRLLSVQRLRRHTGESGGTHGGKGKGYRSHGVPIIPGGGR
jgi:hypothetical protein